MQEVGFAERAYPANKLAHLVDILAARGVDGANVLRGTSVATGDIEAPATLISMRDLVVGYRNAMTLCPDADLAFSIGASVHVSTYGMYGYALLCSTNFRRTMEFAEKYHPLATPLCTIALNEKGDKTHWTIQPALHPSIDTALQNFIVAIQVGMHLALHRDVMGAAFVFERLELTCAEGAGAGLTPELVGCPVVFDQASNRITFRTAWLDEKPELGNRNSYASVVELCDKLLSELSERAGTAGQVRALIVRDIAGRPTLAETAANLQMTARTLRRKLRNEGTSYRELLDELRVRVAIKYLKETSMTNEDIAYALGFSDAANFRHAFRRWTHTTPSAVRRA